MDKCPELCGLLPAVPSGSHIPSGVLSPAGMGRCLPPSGLGRITACAEIDLLLFPQLCFQRQFDIRND